MNMLETIVLGLVQGLTEFIPVSSSGHLVIAQIFFSGASSHLFLEWINIGTLLALLVYFRQRIKTILHDIFRKKNYTLARNITITSIPAGIVGFMLSDIIDDSAFFGSLIVVTAMLVVVGVLMILLEKLPKASAVSSGDRLGSWRSLAIGVAQMCALIPGISRSGSTIIAGRLAGLSPAAAAEYSFLASLPIMIGVALKVMVKSTDRAYFMDNIALLGISNLVAFASGLLAVGFLMRYLERHSLAVFGWYRLALAAVITVWLLVQ